MTFTIDMAEDDKIEEEAYRAVNNVAGMLWQKQKRRIFKNIVSGIMQHMGWTEVKLSKGEGDEIKTDII